MPFAKINNFPATWVDLEPLSRIPFTCPSNSDVRFKSATLSSDSLFGIYVVYP